MQEPSWILDDGGYSGLAFSWGPQTRAPQSSGYGQNRKKLVQRLRAVTPSAKLSVVHTDFGEKIVTPVEVAREKTLMRRTKSEKNSSCAAKKGPVIQVPSCAYKIPASWQAKVSPDSKEETATIKKQKRPTSAPGRKRYVRAEDDGPAVAMVYNYDGRLVPEGSVRVPPSRLILEEQFEKALDDAAMEVRRREGLTERPFSGALIEKTIRHVDAKKEAAAKVIKLL